MRACRVRLPVAMLFPAVRMPAWFRQATGNNAASPRRNDLRRRRRAREKLHPVRDRPRFARAAGLRQCTLRRSGYRCSGAAERAEAGGVAEIAGTVVETACKVWDESGDEARTARNSTRPKTRKPGPAGRAWLAGAVVPNPHPLERRACTLATSRRSPLSGLSDRRSGASPSIRPGTGPGVRWPSARVKQSEPPDCLAA